MSENQVKMEVMLRQHGYCALCGTQIVSDKNGIDFAEEELLPGDKLDPKDGRWLVHAPYEFHHMKMKSDGGEYKPENITMICGRDDHLDAHGGSFNKHIETTPESYPYFNGKDNDGIKVPTEIKSNRSEKIEKGKEATIETMEKKHTPLEKL